MQLSLDEFLYNFKEKNFPFSNFSNDEVFRSILNKGDLLTYEFNNIFSWIIKIKTWHPITHVSIYAGNGYCLSSTRKGVDKYLLSKENLNGIYRPNSNIFDFDLGQEWYNKEARGQKYDWKGILGFIRIVDGGDRDKQFCSEFATRFYRKARFEPFQPFADADKIAPFQLAISPAFHCIWQNWDTRDDS